MLYHVSDTWFKPTVIASPRLVERGEDEPPIKRVCVCPSVIQCLLAIGAYYDYCKLVVYGTEETGSVMSEGVPDSIITEERWFLEPVKFKRLYKLPKYEFSSEPPLCGVDDKELIENLKIHRSRLERLLQ